MLILSNSLYDWNLLVRILNCVVAPITPRHGPRTENTAPLLLRAILLGFPCYRYLATPLVHWLLPSNTKHSSYCCMRILRAVYQAAAYQCFDQIRHIDPSLKLLIPSSLLVHRLSFL
jgi:hypothetical protein